MRYIWIDSLCIVQDDIDDWRAEGSKMASIYSASYLTIAATKSPDSAGGCFAKLAPEDVAQTYEGSNANGQNYTVHVRNQPPHPNMYNSHEYPLFDRAWVLQERLLSPRIIHFGHQELLWECNESRTCECTAWSHESNFNSKAYILGSNASVPALDSLLVSATRWRKLVTEYSTLKLSNERDIFPAIQGIAKHFHKENQCAYYAGLWESSLIEDLLWSTNKFRHSQTRLKSWRAPTWSWASTTHIGWTFQPGMQALATVVAISTIPVGSDTFGEICGGELQLKGRCINAMLVVGTKKHKSMGLVVTHGGRELKLPHRAFHIDRHSSVYGNGTLKLVEMGKSRERMGHGQLYYYLVLQCVDEEKQIYERIGMVHYDPDGRPFENIGEELVLTVV
jgi:hypothetical protein